MVSIPFKRESVFRVETAITTEDGIISFNSLQTGKCIQRKYLSYLFYTSNWFQFPSNGKVYSESEFTMSLSFSATWFQFPSNGKVYSEISSNGTGTANKVFQFPSNGKVYSELLIIESPEAPLQNGFNSLQTGKCIQRNRTNEETEADLESFNSLQTGKCIQSQEGSVFSEQGSDQVSIPFKRESVFRVTRLETEAVIYKVSIPFKRESVFRVRGRGRQRSFRIGSFQFPSNGKVYSEVAAAEELGGEFATIRFQFPSNGKVYSEFRWSDQANLR